MPFVSPWRTIQIAPDAVGLINSNLILNLNEPNKLGDVSWVKPAKYVGIWWAMHINERTWGRDGVHGATTEETMRYMDFAAENGFAGVLVEGWNVGADWESSPYSLAIEERSVTAADRLALQLAPGGGAAVRLARAAD